MRHDARWVSFPVDGTAAHGYLARPAAATAPLPAVIVIQEIWGVDAHVQDLVQRFATAGYVALAPDLYSRIESNVALDEQQADSLQQAFGYMQRLDFAQAVDDAIDALQHLRRLPEVESGV
jgi:carboxymethylenebutenolidase